MAWIDALCFEQVSFNKLFCFPSLEWWNFFMNDTLNTEFFSNASYDIIVILKQAWWFLINYSGEGASENLTQNHLFTTVF